MWAAHERKDILRKAERGCRTGILNVSGLGWLRRTGMRGEKRPDEHKRRTCRALSLALQTTATHPQLLSRGWQPCSAALDNQRQQREIHCWEDGGGDKPGPCRPEQSREGKGESRHVKSPNTECSPASEAPLKEPLQVHTGKKRLGNGP